MDLSTAWPLFICIIAVLCVFASACALGHTRRYKSRETANLEYIADKLNRALEGDSPEPEQEKPDAKARVRDLIPIDSLLEGVSKESLIADRLALIKRMRTSHVKVSLSALQEMTLAREASTKSLSLPSYAANLCMMLGLLGTVVGLAIMVQQIDLGLPSDLTKVTMNSWMESISHIRGVLQGMRTAFSATMTGIASAIVLSFLNHRLSHAQSAFLDRLDRFTTEELLPATVPATEDDSLLERVSLQLERGFGRLDEIVKSNHGTLAQLNSVEKGFIEIVNTMRESNKTDVSERIQGLLGRTSGVMDQVADLNKSLMTVAGSLPDVVKQIEQANRQGITGIDRLIRGYEGSRSKTEEASMARIDQLIRAYEQQRSLMQWPLQIKVVFAFMAALNLALLGYALFR